MSLYNILFGQNINTDIILAIIGFKTSDVERFRDCGFCEEGIFIYTRTGGGNREDYPNQKLIESPYYLSDVNDESDSTYAMFYFRIPEEIRSDVEDFKDIRNKGISARFIQWVLKTIEREKTKNDIFYELYNKQTRLVQESKQTFICETNGLTIVPLDDQSLEIYLSLMEKAGGEQLSYYVMPYVVTIQENVSKWENIDKNKSELEKEMCRIKISLPDKQQIDPVLWERWQKKFETKYPKAIAQIRQDLKE